MSPKSSKIPCKFPASREFEVGDRSDQDCVVSHAVGLTDVFAARAGAAAAEHAKLEIIRHQFVKGFASAPVNLRGAGVDQVAPQHLGSMRDRARTASTTDVAEASCTAIPRNRRMSFSLRILPEDTLAD